MNLKAKKTDNSSIVADYKKRGYVSLNGILEQCGITRFSNGSGALKLLDNPDVSVGGAFMYRPERAAAILLEISPGERFNKLAVQFITGKYQPK